MEAIVAELLAALGAEEVLGVPGLVQGCHAFLDGTRRKRKLAKNLLKFQIDAPNYIQDGTVAVGASRTEQVVIVGLAVRIAVALEKVPRAQLLVAVIAREVLGMPSLAQGCDHLTHDGLVASVTAALLHRVDSLT